MVGYHGVSSRVAAASASPAPNGTAVNTGRPSAPARCTSEVSQHTTRSSFIISAAVSTKVAGAGSGSVSGTSIRPPNGTAAICCDGGPFWSEISRTPGMSASGAKAASGMSRAAGRTSSRVTPRPQLMPMVNPSLAEPRRPSARPAPAPPTRYGTRRRHVVRPHAERAGRAHQRQPATTVPSSGGCVIDASQRSTPCERREQPHASAAAPARSRHGRARRTPARSARTGSCRRGPARTAARAARRCRRVGGPARIGQRLERRLLQVGAAPRNAQSPPPSRPW